MSAQVEAREVTLTLINSSELYRNQVKPVIANLAQHIAAGRFSADKAQKSFLNLIRVGMDSKEWATVYGTWRPSVAARKLAAVEMLEHYADEIRELAAELIGPGFLAVDVNNFDHDSNGNPTAQHHVYTSTSEGGLVRLVNSRKVRREQVGYGDYTDGVRDALKKAGYSPALYEQTGKTGRRTDDSIIVTFQRKAITVI